MSTTRYVFVEKEQKYSPETFLYLELWFILVSTFTIRCLRIHILTNPACIDSHVLPD